MGKLKDMHTAIVELLDDGLGISEIAERLKVSESVVQEVARDMGDFLAEVDPASEDGFLSEGGDE